MEIRPQYRKKPVRTFVVRAGRMTDGQRRAFDLYWYRYGLNLFSGAPDWDVVFGRRAPRVLEIGFGMGDSLLAMAEAEPDKDFIGIEVHPPGVGRLINNAAARGLANLRVYMADAVDVLDECIAEAALSRVQIYFPDPWPKKRHHKRRLVQRPLIEKLRGKLPPGGLLHLATDWREYAEQMLAVIDSVDGLENCAGIGGFAPRPVFRPPTKFEMRGLKLGHGVWDLLYRRC